MIMFLDRMIAIPSRRFTIEMLTELEWYTFRVIERVDSKISVIADELHQSKISKMNQWRTKTLHFIKSKWNRMKEQKKVNE